MFSLIKHADEIDYLVHVEGFGYPLPPEGAITESYKKAEYIAGIFGKKLIKVRSNIHEFAKPYIHWSNHYHGSALASVAHLLSKKIGTWYLASSHPYTDLLPWGSHFALDHLFGSESVEIRHDGAECTRVQKAKRISEFPELLRYIDYGCNGSSCKREEKCIRTLINFDLAGVLEKMQKHPLRIEDIENIKIIDESSYCLEMENYRELLKRPDKKRILNALKIPLNVYLKKRNLPILK